MAGRSGRIPGAKPQAKPGRSPLAPKRLPKLPPLGGVRLATGAAGIRYPNRTDVLLVELAPGTRAAGVFTRSKTASAPVEWCRARAKAGRARALVVNSGNANAFTGKAGVEGAAEIAATAADAVGCSANEVFLASTGVIGEPLPRGKIEALLPKLARAASPEGWLAAAEAIMTTDTWPKLATLTAEIGGARVRLNGIAKGSGMIAPDMATMLAFVFTDAKLPAPVLRALLRDGVQPSFNSITVDSDTSTSDTLLLFATGKAAPHPPIRNADDPQLADFRRAVTALLLDLALQVVRDGEGASKVIQVDVWGAASDASARKIALAIANSPLVKTAIAGGDANWGRVVMAIGKAGEPADRDKLRIWFFSPKQWGRENTRSTYPPPLAGEVDRRAAKHAKACSQEKAARRKGAILVAENGARAAGYNERAATKAVSGQEVTIAVDLGLGKGSARIYTCDLTHGYIGINASYRS